jgi:phospholipid/cholesterol/gamma-HCH transport system permease protein
VAVVIALVGAQSRLFGRAVLGVRETRGARAFFSQVASLGGATVPLVTFGMAFFGMVMTTIAWAQARKYTGSLAVVGPAYFELILREFAPLLTALLAASRQAAFVSAELGSMAVNEQLEAMELSAADPVTELVTPRLFASVAVMPLLTIIGGVAASLSAMLTVTFFFHEDGLSFISPQYVTFGDLACAFTKSLAAGAYIPIAAALRGLRATGGAAAVGEAVTVGVVEACMGCLVLDFLIAVFFHAVGA